MGEDYRMLYCAVLRQHGLGDAIPVKQRDFLGWTWKRTSSPNNGSLRGQYLQNFQSEHYLLTICKVGTVVSKLHRVPCRPSLNWVSCESNGKMNEVGIILTTSPIQQLVLYKITVKSPYTQDVLRHECGPRIFKVILNSF